jgi:TolB-like protein
MGVYREKQEPVPAGGSVASLVVFPFENLTGSAVPLKALRESLSEELRQRGFHLIDEDVLDRFIARHRVRYTAGIDEQTARALKDETGVEGVLLTSVELYSGGVVPRIALTSRLVSTGDVPEIMWVDGVGLAGDDHPGILGLGIIKDLGALVRKAFGMLGKSLASRMARQGRGKESAKAERKFRPKIAYRSADLEGERKYTVAIAPFFNRSQRKNAGDVLALQFVRALGRLGNFEVIEPGLVRQAFLGVRIIMDEGVSLSDANALFAVLDADLVLGGEVLDYQDYQGPNGTAKVNFMVQLIERESQRVVWSSESYNWGSDGVFFFDVGQVNTAHAMAARMADSIGGMLVRR